MYLMTESEHNELLTLIKDLVREVQDIKRAVGAREYYGVAQIAEIQGVSKAVMYSKPWLWPNFRRGRYTYDQIVQWAAIPEEDRRREWELKTHDEQKKILEGAA